MRPTSPTGRRPRGAAEGYTLIELLVVLSIVAALAALATPMVSGLAGPRIDQQAAAVGEAFRAARAQAIGENREIVVAIDTGRGIVWSAAGGELVRLAPGIELGLVTASTERIAAATGGIRFLPDGSASGGAVTLAQGALHATVEVDWFDGSVEVRRGAL